MSKIFEKYKLIFATTLFFLSFQPNIIAMFIEGNGSHYTNQNLMLYLETEERLGHSKEYFHELFIKQNKELYIDWLTTEISRKMTDGKFKSWIERLLYEDANASYLFIEYVDDFISYMKNVFTDYSFLDNFLEYEKINLGHSIISFLDFYTEDTDDEEITEEITNSIIKIENKIFNDFFLKKIIIDIMSKIRPIKNINLSNNSMFEIPTYLSEIKSLEFLDMQDNNILPSYNSNMERSNFKIFENLQSLVYLNIHDQDYENFESFPERIGHLVKDLEQNVYIGHVNLYENNFYSEKQKIFVIRSIAFETANCINENANNITNILRQNIESYQGTEAQLWQRLIKLTNKIMLKIKNVFCNTFIINDLLKTKKLNLKNILPKINSLEVDSQIFEKIIFEEIIVKIFYRWTRIDDLNLSNNTIKYIPRNLHLLKSLKKCDLSKNFIEIENPQKISLPDKLILLNIENNKAKKFTDKKRENFPKIIWHMAKDDDRNIYRST